MLTSAARAALRTVEVVIVDEIHALVGNERGAHLALSLERLELLTGRPLQRVGLSATQRPLAEVARFLAGARPVTLDDQIVGADRPEELLLLDAALTALAGEDERKARVVELHYFGGLTQAEVAQALEVHPNTVARDLRFAQAWLQRHMSASA